MEHAPTKWLLFNAEPKNNEPLLAWSPCKCGKEECHWTSASYPSSWTNVKD